jgi:hypothetical protein
MTWRENDAELVPHLTAGFGLAQNGRFVGVLGSENCLALQI